MITGSLCRAARALVQVSRDKLSENSTVSVLEIEQFERYIDAPEEHKIQMLQDALEGLGAVFIPEEGSSGFGVRLKFSRSVADRLANLVNEGGPSAKDALP